MRAIYYLLTISVFICYSGITGVTFAPDEVKSKASGGCHSGMQVVISGSDTDGNNDKLVGNPTFQHSTDSCCLSLIVNKQSDQDLTNKSPVSSINFDAFSSIHFLNRSHTIDHLLLNDHDPPDLIVLKSSFLI